MKKCGLLKQSLSLLEKTRLEKVAKKDRSFLVRYQGINTGVRGSRYGERRPDAIIFDDAILNTAAAYSKVMSDNLGRDT